LNALIGVCHFFAYYFFLSPSLNLYILDFFIGFFK
jgi:hypothetical protein